MLLQLLSTVISIHAPTRGATWQTNEMQKSHKISIHAPTRGATKQYRAKTNVNAKFQSTLPRGERLPVQINILPALFISIHAPTRGATIARVEQ